jgi:hypothetical protein
MTETSEFAVCPLTMTQYALTLLNPTEQSQARTQPAQRGMGAARRPPGDSIDYASRVLALPQPKRANAALARRQRGKRDQRLLSFRREVLQLLSQLRRRGGAVAADEVKGNRRSRKRTHDTAFRQQPLPPSPPATTKKKAKIAPQDKKRKTQSGAVITESKHSDVGASTGSSGGKFVVLTNGRHVARQLRETRQEEWTDELMEQLTLLCVRLWHLLSPEPPCRTQPTKYTFKYHCLVVFYQAIEPNGFSCPAFTIPHIPLLDAGLPRIADLRLPPLFLDYTPVYKIFLSAVRGLAAPLRMPGQLLRMPGQLPLPLSPLTT